MNQLSPADVERGRKAKNQSRNDRSIESEYSNRPINRHFVQLWQTFRHKAQQKIFRPEENRQTSNSAEQRQKQTFRQQLAGQSRLTCSNRAAKSQFAYSRTPAREQQIGNVHTTDDEHQRHGTEQ